MAHERSQERHRAAQPHAQAAPSTPAIQAEKDVIRDAGRSLQHEAEQTAEQLKERAVVMGKEAKEQMKLAARSIREEINFIRQKFMGSRLREHVLQLGATFIVAAVMHVVLNFLSSKLAFSTQLFTMYLEHWQPWSFLIGGTVLSRSVDHLRPIDQYAWSVTALCWLTSVVGWSAFPFAGVLEKAAVSLPLTARNFIWLGAFSPVINWTVRKLKERA